MVNKCYFSWKYLVIFIFFRTFAAEINKRKEIFEISEWYKKRITYGNI